AVLAGQTPFTVEAVPAGRLRLGRLGGYFDHLQTEVRDAFDRALASLSDGGAQIDQVSIDAADRTAETYLHLALPEAAHAHAAWLDTRAASYTPAVHARIASGRETPAPAYLAARAFAEVLAAQVDAALEACDALVLPTEPLVAQPLGTTEVRLDRLDNGPVPLRAAMLRHTQLFNLTGHPAITLPVPADGLPVGLQLVGRRGHTAALLTVAKAVEMRLSHAA
ncbi:MAG TPA: amidase family protein, partial [Gammaproteobacteria bacterium]|nr:amidase family protein [Gammaproteobacteria bacterium]